jgi:hypothetical protein
MPKGTHNKVAFSSLEKGSFLLMADDGVESDVTITGHTMTLYVCM